MCKCDKIVNFSMSMYILFLSYAEASKTTASEISINTKGDRSCHGIKTKILKATLKIIK